MGVVECHSGIRMSEHLRHILQLYIIRQRDCCGKSIAGGVHCKVLFNAAIVSNLLQVRIHLLIGVHRKNRFVRHPMYLASLMMFLAMPLVLGSWWALLPFGFYVPVIVSRTLDEERLLRCELAGYDDYCSKVRWRIIPFVW